MNRLIKYPGCVFRSPKNALETMEKEKANFITWVNNHNCKRYLAKKEYIENIYHNKFISKGDETKKLDQSLCIQIGTGLNTDEIRFELLALGLSEIIIKEGFCSKTLINDESIDIIDLILSNNKFDYNLLFRRA